MLNINLIMDIKPVAESRQAHKAPFSPTPHVQSVPQIAVEKVMIKATDPLDQILTRLTICLPRLIASVGQSSL
jgi:hypothetical protein